MKKNIFIAVVALFAMTFLILYTNKCIQDNTQNNIQDNHLLIERLQSQIAQDSLMKIGYKGMNKDLMADIEQYKVLLSKEKKKVAVIALKYANELKRVQSLPDDSAVGLFLDVADCGELPIMKYDSMYLIPIDPIRVYNDLAVGFNEQVEVNRSLNTQITIQDSVITRQSKVIQNDSIVLALTESSITKIRQEQQYQSEQLKLSTKLLRKQKERTAVAWGVCAVTNLFWGWMLIVK